MKWNILFFLVILLTASWAEVGDLISSVQKNYQSHATFQAEFVQSTAIELLNKNVEERGTLTFTKPGKFLIHYRGVQERQYICDGHTLWIYHPKIKEGEIYPHVSDMVSHEALSFLGGLGNMTKEFQVKAEPDFWISLVPRNKKSPLKKIRLKINPTSFWATEVVLLPRQGNESHYRFSKINTATDREVDIFSFRPPPGAQMTTFD